MAAAFPAFIRAEYDASGNGFAEFQRHGEQTATNVRKRFESDFNEIKSVVANALTIPRNPAGALDLGVDRYRGASRAAQANAAALREVATAAEVLARETGDTTAATRNYITAARAAAVEAEHSAAQANAQAITQQRLQEALNRTATVVTGAVGGQRALTQSVGAQRQAYLQAGQQVQDFAIQVQGGQSVITALSQQGSQLAFVLQGVGGKAGAAAAFFGGPWGTAILLATAVLAPFVSKLFEAGEAAAAAKLGADGLSDAQSALGGMFDLTSGKLEHQNALLIANARLTAINLRSDALKNRADAGSTLQAIGGAGSTISNLFGSIRPIGGISPAAAFREAQGRSGSFSSLLGAVRDAPNDAARQLAVTKALETSKGTQFGGTGTTREKFQQAVVDYAASFAKEQVADQVEKSLADGKLATGLRRDHKAKKPPKPNDKAFRSAEFGRDTADQIANISGQFDDAPRAIDRAAAAMRKLDDIADDLQQRKPPGYQKLLGELEKARQVVADFPDSPFRKWKDDAAEVAKIDAAMLAGGRDLAEAMRTMIALERQGKALTQESKDEILASVVAERQRSEVIRDQQDLLQAQLNIVSDLRRSTESFINDALHGKLRPQNLVKGIFDSYTALWSKMVTEKLFGAGFRSAEDSIYGGVAKAADGLALQVDSTSGFFATAGDAALQLAQAMSAASTQLSTVPAPSAAGRALVANDNGSSTGTTDEDGTIVVTGKRLSKRGDEKLPTSRGIDGLFHRTVGGKTYSSLFPDYSDKLAKPLEALAKGVGIKPDSAAFIGKNVGKAFDGAAVGSIVGATINPLLNKLGVRTSKVGAQIGGAVGSFLPIPFGREIGAVVGSVIGGLFKKTKTGFAVVTEGGVSSGGKLGAASAASGGTIQSGVNSIVQALGGQAGSYTVSIGKRGDYFRVSGTGATNLGDKNTSRISGLLYDGKDEAEADRIAILSAIQQGAAKGIRAGAQHLLEAGKDLDAQLQKAVKFTSVFDALKQATDPAGYAIEQLNKQFADLKSVFDEAGASTEEYAQLQQLYGIQQKQVVDQVTQQITGAYKSLLNDLLTGDNGLSLRDRLANAKATFDPLAADVGAGKTVDAAAFADAAKSVIDLSRQLYGSQDGYFGVFDQATGLAKQALASQDALITAATNKDSPFTSTGSVANDNLPLIGAIGDQTDAIVGALNGQLSVLNTNVARLVGQGGASGGGNAGVGFNYA